MEIFKQRYLKLTNGIYGITIALDQIDEHNNIQEEISNYLDADYNNRFSIELIMMPNWASKNKAYKFGSDYFTHIRLKK